MNLTRRQMLIGAAAAGGVLAAPPARAARPGHLVTVFVKGGWDMSTSFEPRLDDPFIDGPRLFEDPAIPSDREYTRSWGDITVACNDYKRPAVRTFFDKWSDRCAVLKGVWTGAIGHESSTVRVLTGSMSNGNPDLGAIFGGEFGKDLPLGYVVLGAEPYVGPFAASTGQVGFNAQLKLLFDRDVRFSGPKGTGLTYPQNQLSDPDQAAIDAFFADRLGAWKDRFADGGQNSRRLDDLDQSVLRAGRFEDASADLVEALTFGASPSFHDQAAMGVQLLEREVCKAVLLDSGYAWDSHTDLVVQQRNFQGLFTNLSGLMGYLDARGLVDDTLVVVVSEMTRAPRMNSTGGKDHWPHATVMVLGSSVYGQRVHGGFDDGMESMPVDYATGETDPSGQLLRYDNLVAGLLSVLDVDPGRYLPEATPFTAYSSLAGQA